MYTVQTLLQRKIFGNHLQGTKPLEYRRPEWQELNKGRERSVRLIVRAMLGVPSAHQGENAMWSFQFDDQSILVVYLNRGTVIDLAVRAEELNEIQEAVDFLIEEVATRLRQL